MSKQKDYIEELRRRRFGIGLDDIPESLINYVEDREKEQQDVARLASEIHSRAADCILELLQNADDNEYGENVLPEVIFILKKDLLIMQNNEKGFTKENVDAICRVGGTTKGSQKRKGYIGEKGIGFKSVFKITDNPQIYSNGFNFEFRYNREKPRTLLIPEWVDNPPPYVDLNKTNIVLPLKNEAKKEISSLLRIEPSILLFLQKIKKIKLEGEGLPKSRRGVYKREDLSEGGIVLIKSPTHTEKWKVIRKSLPVPIGKRDEKRRDIEETELCLAFPLQESRAIKTKTYPLFAFLPVRDYGFKFIVQGDFLLAANREDIEYDKMWNEWLRDKIPELFVEAIEFLKKDSNFSHCFYKYIPLENEITNDFFKPVAKETLNKLQNEAFILSESGEWCRPHEVVTGNKMIRELLPNDILKSYTGMEFVSTAITIPSKLLKSLGIREVSLDEICKCLENESWFKNKDDEWFAGLYAYLAKNYLKDENKEKLNKLKIIKLESGDLISANEKQVFFPLDRGKRIYGFENEIEVIKNSILNVKKFAKMAKKFLKFLGVREANIKEIVENYILALYQGDGWKSKKGEVLEGTIRYLKDNLPILKSQKGGKELIEKIKETIYLRTIQNGKPSYAKPGEVYLTSKYGGNKDLEELFKGVKNVHFLHPQYISGETRKGEIKKWAEFFKLIGVNTMPRLIHYEGVYDGYRYPLSGERKGWSTRPEKVNDWRLSPELESIILQPNFKSRRQKLFKLLNDNWKNHYKDFIKMKYIRFYYYEQSESLSSSFIRDLRQMELPTKNGGFAKPNEIFLYTKQTYQLLGDEVPYLAVEEKYVDRSFAEALGINVEANVSGVLNNLRRLVNKGSHQVERFKKLYEFLDKHFELGSEEIIKAFTNEPLIYIPKTSQKYFKLTEVVWEDVSELFKTQWGSLRKHYPMLENFFINKLHIPKKPSARNYADLLAKFQRYRMDYEKEKILFKIYCELSNFLEREGEKLKAEDWWNKFCNERIFYTHRHTFVSKYSQLFLNDDWRIYDLFAHKEGIYFLAFQDRYPEFKAFIKAMSIKSASQEVQIEFQNAENPKFDEHLTEEFRSFLMYVLRYLYHEEYELYKKFTSNDSWIHLQNLRFYTAENLCIKLSLGTESVIEPNARTFYDRKTNRFLIKEEFKEDETILASEICKLFDSPKGLDDFIYNILSREDPDEIERWLREKQLDALPLDERQRLKLHMPAPTTPSAEIVDDEFLKQDVLAPIKEETTTDETLMEEKVFTQEVWKQECEPKEASIKWQVYSPRPKKEVIELEREISTPSIIEPNLSEEERKAIGRWGEEYAMAALTNKLSNQYPNCEIRETGEGIIILVEGKEKARIIWLNREQDALKEYDIKIVYEGVEEYYEVKSTPTESKRWFPLSKNQWDFAKKQGDKFHILRVYNAGIKSKAFIADIVNPYEKWEKGEIELKIKNIRIKI